LVALVFVSTHIPAHDVAPSSHTAIEQSPASQPPGPRDGPPFVMSGSALAGAPPPAPPSGSAACRIIEPQPEPASMLEANTSANIGFMKRRKRGAGRRSPQ
jgi:hypothetical protein